MGFITMEACICQKFRVCFSSECSKFLENAGILCGKDPVIRDLTNEQPVQYARFVSESHPPCFHQCPLDGINCLITLT